MKIQLEKVAYREQESFLVRHYRKPYFEIPWHYHPENELTLIVQGTGTRFVGDSVEPYEVGDLVLIRKNVPHFWLSHEEYYQQPPIGDSESVCIQFTDDVFPNKFGEMNEFETIRTVLKKAERGLVVHGAGRKEIAQGILEMRGKKGMDKVSSLYLLLERINETPDVEPLASVSYQSHPEKSQHPGVLQVLQYIDNHFTEEIQLDTLANIACINRSSLCRQFKKSTDMSVFQYINETRIAYARKLLANSNFSITQVAYESGFNSISNFHKQFSKLVELSPKEYRAKYLG